MERFVACRVDGWVMIRLAGCYNQQQTLPEGTVVMVDIADLYCLTEAALVERSDCPNHKLLGR